MKVKILGAGTWGTALAYVLYKNNIDVSVWGRNKDKISKINSTSTHPNLKNFIVPRKIVFTSKFPDLSSGIIILATSTGFINNFINKLNNISNCNIVIACKGFYKTPNSNYLLPSESIIKRSDSNIQYDNLCVLTGPSHAEELINEKATAILAASTNIEFAKSIQKMFSNQFLRVYTLNKSSSNDIDINNVISTEIGGAVKNIISIASGICDGLNLGDNAKAALVSRGMSEIVEYSKKIHASSSSYSDTLFGLSGLGDLIATAYSAHSRNRKFGQLIGEGVKPSDALIEVGMTVEGFDSSIAVKEICDSLNFTMPICKEVYEIVHNNKNPNKSLYSLMTRKLTNEM